MSPPIDQELVALRAMTVRQLRSRYEELFGEPPRSTHKEQLVRRIIWRIQALAEGDLTDRARQRAAELARDADLRLRPPMTRPDDARNRQPKPSADRSSPPRDPRLPPPGTLLVRVYQDRTLQVTVLERGFEFDGQIHASLTAVARRATGQHWNGFHFFGLTEATQ